MKRTERSIGFFNVKIIARAEGIVAPVPLTAAKAFLLIDGLPNKILKRKGARQTQFISASTWTDEEYCFILNKTDKELAPPIFNDVENEIRREVEKVDGEAHEFSSHCRIKFNQINQYAHAHLFMEIVGGFTPLKVAKILQRLLRRAKTSDPAAFQQPHPNGALGGDGKPLTINVNFDIEIEGHISQQFANDLQAGTISSIELIDEREFVQDFDEQGYFREKKKVVTIGVKDNAPAWGDKVETLKQMLTSKQASYGKAVVVYKKQNGKVDRVKWDKDDGFDLHHVRKEHFTGLVPPMKSTYIEFHADLLNRMRTLTA